MLLHKYLWRTGISTAAQQKEMQGGLLKQATWELPWIAMQCLASAPIGHIIGQGVSCLLLLIGSPLCLNGGTLGSREGDGDSHLPRPPSFRLQARIHFRSAKSAVWKGTLTLVVLPYQEKNLIKASQVHISITASHLKWQVLTPRTLLSC
jgi:hypothetical protein